MNVQDKTPVTALTQVSFGEAITALKAGKRVSRAGWNGKGLFIFMQVPSDINEEVIHRMQSLPDFVKAVFLDRFANAESGQINQIHYRNQLAMVYPDNTIYGWVASPSDVLETDWCILD